MGIASGTSSRIATEVIGGGAPTRIELPLDLAEAVVATFAASGLGPGLTALYRDQAGERAVSPYLVYSITSGATLRTDSDSYWRDQRIRFTVFSTGADAANSLREAVWDSYKDQPFFFQTGASMPFFETNRSEGKEPNKSVGNTFLYKAMLEVSARTRRGD